MLLWSHRAGEPRRDRQRGPTLMPSRLVDPHFIVLLMSYFTTMCTWPAIRSAWESTDRLQSRQAPPWLDFGRRFIVDRLRWGQPKAACGGCRSPCAAIQSRARPLVVRPLRFCLQGLISAPPCSSLRYHAKLLGPFELSAGRLHGKLPTGDSTTPLLPESVAPPPASLLSCLDIACTGGSRIYLQRIALAYGDDTAMAHA